MYLDEWTTEDHAEADARAKFDPLDPDAPLTLPARAELLPLTAKQYAFANAFAKCGNVTEAGERAGISRTTANRYLTDGAVLAEIDRQQKLASIYSSREVADVMADIYETYRRALAGGDLKTALKALELEAKHRGALVEKIEVNSSLDLASAITSARHRLTRPEGTTEAGQDHNI